MIHFSSSDGQAVLPADYTFTAADQGKHTFQVVFKTTGAQALAVADSSNGSLKASANVTVATKAQAIVLSGLSPSVVAGTQQIVIVAVTDSFGNPIPDYTGTIHFTSSDAQAILPADYTFTAPTRAASLLLTLNTTGNK